MGLKKCMTFTVNRNLVFIDSMQFMNSSLDELIKILSDNDFKYLSLEFAGELLELIKQKDVYPHEYLNSFKRFFDDKLLDKREFYSLLRGKCISENDYLHAVNVWNAFEMKAIGDIMIFI